MTHRTATIEVNHREAEALRNITRFVAVWKLGRGEEKRMEFKSDEKHLRTWCSFHSSQLGKGCCLYAVGLVGGLEVTVLAATLTPRQGKWHWKFADGFSL